MLAKKVPHQLNTIAGGFSRECQQGTQTVKTLVGRRGAYHAPLTECGKSVWQL